MRPPTPLGALARRCLVAVLLVAVALARPAQAQAPSSTPTGTIRGRVVDARSDQPIPDVQLSVTGATVSAITDVRGQFTLTGVPAGTVTLAARRLGFQRAAQAVRVVAGQVSEARFALQAVATSLDEVVVTGTAGDAQKRVLGNSIATLNVADVTTKASVQNISEVLQSRVPGVTLLPGSGTPGTGTDIRIRGTSTLQGTNGATRPVFFIDGVRMNDGQAASFSPTASGAGGAGGSQVVNVLDFISPNDIESIEVIKGPAAAALYGADAAAGVIQIITKRGSRAQQKPTWTVRVDAGANQMALRQPDNFTNCDPVKIAALSGPVGNQVPTWGGCQGVAPFTVLTDNPFERTPSAFRDGSATRVNASTRGGGQNFSYYLTADRDINNGVQFNSFDNRWSGRGNFDVTLSPTIDVKLNVAYLSTDIRLPIGDESGNGILLSGNRGRPGFGFGPNAADPGWRTIIPDSANRYNNLTNTNRLILGGTINWRPWQRFRNTLTLGFDRSTGLATLISEPTSVDTPAGLTAQRVLRPRTFSIDYLGTFDWNAGANWGMVTSFGTQIIGNRSEVLGATGVGLGAPDVTLIQTAQTITASNTFSENNTVGYYVNQQVGYRNRLFVTASLRADDNSAFGTDFNVLLLPRLSASYVVSEEPYFRDGFRNLGIADLKLRAAWGRAGRNPQPFSATRTWTSDRVTLGNATGSALRTSAFGNDALKPERSEEWESGFDATFVGGRGVMEFTYYIKRTTDLIAAQPLAPSLGFAGSRFVNLGAIRNAGVEFALGLTPVQRRNVTWDTRLNVGTNDNQLLSFGDPTKLNEVPPSQAYGVVQEHRPGYPLGGYWVPGINRNADGSVRLTATGAVDTTTTRLYAGNPLPTHELGFSNTFTFFRYFRLFALLDYKGGFEVFNGKERNRCQPANDNCERNNLVPNGWRAPLTAADSLGARELLVNRTQLRPFIEPGDFLKLRDLSLTFTMPPSWAARLPGRPGQASVTLTGRNLGILWTRYTGVDPEVNGYANRNNFIRVDQYSMPMVRRVLASVNLTF
ncbi:MAG: SusC/RagA family TonB-linked outer membrane protein [Gemmatimonadaceae bacterium]|nr:SusC/RagA family TonB-linked outer membrane protein [Gemmatimonadaceae bacterium]